MISKQRLLTVTVGWALAFVFLSLASIEVFNVIICVIALVAFNEFLRMYRVNKNIGFHLASLIIFMILSASFTYPRFRNLGIDLTLAPLIILALALTQKTEQTRANQIVIIIIGLAYLSFLLNYLVLIRVLPNGRELILVLSLGTWARDLGAFVFGQLMRQRHVIQPEVSPKKTYEGAVGGLVFALIAVIASATWLIPDWTLIDMIATSILIGVLGQVGDLVESWFKRNASVIDSSRILPGQGGFLDSIDSFIYTAPAMYFYIVLRMTMA